MTPAHGGPGSTAGWELLDQATVPGSQTPMDLWRHGADLVIRVAHRELMRSSVHGSEDALAELACGTLARRPDMRVLVGGLGMGFTLAAALRTLGPDARVVVAELVPAVVRWNRGPLGRVAGHPLDDPRTEVREGDVVTLVQGTRNVWDAILLDVDNGPHGLTSTGNDWLYSWRGLDGLHEALRDDGVLGVWSAAPDGGFTRRMTRAGFKTTAHEVRSRGKQGGSRHTVWTGVRVEPPRR